MFTGLSQAQRSLSSRLNSFSFECIGNSQTDDEIVISNSLKEFAKLIDLIEDERRRMVRFFIYFYIFSLLTFFYFLLFKLPESPILIHCKSYHCANTVL